MSEKIENGWTEQQKEIERLRTEIASLRKYKTEDGQRKGDLFAKKVADCAALREENAALLQANGEIIRLKTERDILRTEIQDYAKTVERLNADNGDLLSKMQPIRGVWERFKHLDILLSDESWMKEEGHPMTPQRHCLYDLWTAIKDATK